MVEERASVGQLRSDSEVCNIHSTSRLRGWFSLGDARRAIPVVAQVVYSSVLERAGDGWVVQMGWVVQGYRNAQRNLCLGPLLWISQSKRASMEC